MYNLFNNQNPYLVDTIYKTLGYTEYEEGEEFLLKKLWATKPIISEAFHYLFLRFGSPTFKYDSNEIYYEFKVKEFAIGVEITSSWINFYVYGNLSKSKYRHHPPYWIRYNKEAEKEEVKSKLYTMRVYSDDVLTKEQEAMNDKVWEMYLEKYNIETDEQVEEREENSETSFYTFANQYNHSLIKESYPPIASYNEKYGYHHLNSYKRFALKTLEQFIKNLLVPIYVNDVPRNIKGRGGEAFLSFQNNIKIEKI